MYLRVLFMFFLFTIVSCHKVINEFPVDKTSILSTDYRIFQGTEAWLLAKYTKKGDIEGIKKEIENNPNLLDFQEPVYGMSVLHLSIYNDNYKSFLQLLDSKVNLQTYDYEHCTSPIIMVCGLDEKKYLKYLKKLIEYGAKINDVECDNDKIKEATNRTPLMEAIRYGNKKMVEYLIDNGVDINFVNIDKVTALGYSVLVDEFDITYLLLQKGADCNLILYYKYDKYQNKKPVYLKDILSNNKNMKNSKYYINIKSLATNLGC